MRDSQASGRGGGPVFLYTEFRFVHRNVTGDGEERWYGNNCNNSTTYTKIRCFNEIDGKPFDAAEIEKAK